MARATHTERPRFLVDENLAGLTRWLRFSGFDAVTVMGWNDIEVAQHARANGLVLVTRDVALAREMEGEPVIRVHSDDVRDQLLEVLRATPGFDPERWFSLCAECNVELEELDRATILADERIPSQIKSGTAEQQRCWTCRSCLRVYWKGSHYDRSIEFLSRLKREIDSAFDLP